MLFASRRKPRSVFSVAMLASLAFIALAIWGWQVPVGQIWTILLGCLLLLVALVVAAALVVVVFKALQHCWRKRE